MTASEDRPRPGRGAVTLLEGFIVLALLGFVVWIAMRGARIRRDEAAAASALVALVRAEEAYKDGITSRVYGRLDTVEPWCEYARREIRSREGPQGGIHNFYPALRTEIASARRSGYTFSLTVGTPADSNYACVAVPLASGRRSFFVDSSGVIRWRRGGAASSADPPIE